MRIVRVARPIGTDEGLRELDPKRRKYWVELVCANCLVLQLLVVSPLPAQLIPQSGDRVRVSLETDHHRVVGVFGGQQKDSVRIRLSRTRWVTIANPDVARVEISFGRGSYGKKGAVVGFVATAAVLLGYTVAFAQESDAPGAVNFLSLGVFSLAGAGIGFVIGSAVRWESWQATTFQAGPNSPSRRSLGLGVRFGF